MPKSVLAGDIKLMDCFTHHESQRAYQSHHQQSQQGVPWRIDERPACLRVDQRLLAVGRSVWRPLVMLTFLTLMILEQFHGLERRGPTNELVSELGFVIGIRLVVASILLVHLLVIVLSVVYDHTS